MRQIIITASIIFFIGIVTYCNFAKKDVQSKEVLLPLKIIKLSVPEPSGLVFEGSTNTLWTVSDETSQIYNIDTNGNIIKTLSVKGKDLEGITFVADSLIAIVLERKREVVLLNKEGREQNRFRLKLKGNLNEGLEGISYNKKNKHLYLVNEMNPCLLIETTLSGEIIAEHKLKISKDLSGLSYDDVKDELWIISDESKAVYKCKPDGTLIKEFKVDIKQIEGIAFDFTNSKLFLISDKTEKLYIFDLP
ncbi:MAG: SdiA-regulated domain-containing protein [Ignavibacteriales bacterium]|nr:SdiA-regulated domain-containing protein [Ignavibacteriales bacterium]